ncbi:hypothetical protein C0991_001070 [Blastosporella zonata]|nr:hypothetical protein C0991_001070 [Blastosporella zonata]
MQTLTVTARSPSSLLRSIRALAPNSSPLLFALSTNLPQNDLSAAVDTLTALSPSTVGCLSAPVIPSRVSCSLAFFSDALLFRSTLPGRAAPQVGRWHAFREKGVHKDEFSGWADAWTKTRKEAVLPRELCGVQPTGIIYLTDQAPEGLLSALTAFPDVPTLGLIASSTPFITGRPVTLFHNGSIYDSGAVGIALTKPLLSGSTPLKTAFRACVPISKPMVVTQCEGNMINALDESSPTQLLLSSIRASGMDMDAAGSFKEDETFLLGASSSSRMYRITAGDPSRGPISIEPQNVAPPVGSSVQFFHLPKSLPTTTMDEASRGSINLQTCREGTDIVSDHDFETELGSDPARTEESFIASSENGFLVSDGSSSWTCTVPGGSVSLPLGYI